MELQDFEKDPRLFLFTSLTAGSSHIITATSRLETILKANKIPFQAIDTATDEKARKLWQRRAQKKKLPGLVKDGYVIGDLEEVEEWNEFGELKENIGPVPATYTAPAGARQGVNIRPLAPGSPPEVENATDMSQQHKDSTAYALVDESSRIALPGAAEIAARGNPRSPSILAADNAALKKVKSDTSEAETPEKAEPLNAAKEVSKSHPSLDHLSAPASRIQSGTASPQNEPAAVPVDIVDEPVPTAARQHRGSEVVDAPPEEIKKLESVNALQEDPIAEDEADTTAKHVSHLTFKEPKETHEQDAKEPTDAAKSVAD